MVGTNVALFDSKGIIYSYNYGYANKEKQIKSNNDSLYMIGSNTKVMTAIGILKLMEEGNLALDDDIKKFIPEFEVQSYFAYDKITIENLLMHRSGLVSDLFGLILDKTRDYHEVIDELKDTYLTAEPGKMFSYSNVGYTVLGIAIERVSGLKYTEYIQNVIAKPLGIQIHFLLNEADRKSHSSCVSLCYNQKGESVEELLSTMLPAGSNTYMSLNDFVKFGQLFLYKNNSVLKRESLELMETLNIKEAIDAKLQNVGYGLIHNSHNYGEKVGKVLGHGGDATYHHSVFDYLPKWNIGVIVMTNSEQGVGASRTVGETVLLEYLKEKKIFVEKVSSQHKYVPCDAKQYIGRYATALGMIDIQQNRKNELITSISKIPVKLQACEDGYMQCRPVRLWHKLPPVKKSIQNIRVKIITYFDEEVIVVEQCTKYYSAEGIIGCRYEQTQASTLFKEACGEYRVYDEHFRNLHCKCLLKQEDDVIILEIEALNKRLKIKNCLKVVDDNLAITQGFGRNARQSVRIKKNTNKYYLDFCGVVFEKI